MGLDTVPMGIIAGTVGSLLASPVTTVVAPATPFVLPAGVYSLTFLGANTTYQVFDGTAWQTVVAAGGIAPLIYSDGVSYRFNNAGGGNQNVTYQKIG